MYATKIMKEQAQKCSRCGICAGVCPVFRELQQETYSSRGKVEVAEALLAGELSYSDYTEDLFSKCLLCLTCKEACPAGVDQSKMILGTRAELARRRGLPFSKKIAFKYLLKHRSLFGTALKAFSYLQVFLPKANSHGQLRHLPFFLSAFGKGRLIPHISGKPLRSRFAEINPPSSGETRLRVALFAGCFIDFVDPAIGRSLIRVLGRHGIEVIFPKKQTCCGIPVFMSGDIKNGVELMKMNLKAFAPYGFDAVVTACATCGSALKESYKILAEEAGGEWPARVEAFSAKVSDIAEFLATRVELSPREKEKVTVTYHDPCHLSRAQGVMAQPRKVISRLPGVTLVEMSRPQRCCGGGGSFSFYNYELSKLIGQRKIEDIESTQASVVATGCPGCMLQLKDRLGQKGSPIQVKHLIELVDEAGA